MDIGSDHKGLLASLSVGRPLLDLDQETCCAFKVYVAELRYKRCLDDSLEVEALERCSWEKDSGCPKN